MFLYITILSVYTVCMHLRVYTHRKKEVYKDLQDYQISLQTTAYRLPAALLPQAALQTNNVGSIITYLQQVFCYDDFIIFFFNLDFIFLRSKRCFGEILDCHDKITMNVLGKDFKV